MFMIKHKFLSEKRPDLVEEWNYEKNDGLSPESVKINSNRKVWWKCKHGHEWQAIVSDRVSKHIGCPVCSNHKVLAGYNDLETMCPEIAEEWNIEKNGSLLPSQVVSGSAKVVWWKCKQGHEWKTPVCARTNKGASCPYCSNKKVLVGYNDLATVRPEIARDWNYKKNRDLLPTMFSYGSGRKVWWKCSTCGHEWQASINSRNQGNTCPHCKKIIKGKA